MAKYVCIVAVILNISHTRITLTNKRKNNTKNNNNRNVTVNINQLLFRKLEGSGTVN